MILARDLIEEFLDERGYSITHYYVSERWWILHVSIDFKIRQDLYGDPNIIHLVYRGFGNSIYDVDLRDPGSLDWVDQFLSGGL